MSRHARKVFSPNRLLVAASIVALTVGMPAHAQDLDEEELATAQDPSVTAPTLTEPAVEQETQASGDIVVTGTRIRGIAPTGSNVIGLNASDIEETGLATSTDLLRSLPQVSNIGMDEARTSGAQRAIANLSAASAINLRGLGPEATLTLVNGRRVPVGNGEGRFFDTNAIPAIALERVEIVADGSSAIYGSDAMTGVANLITRRSFDGLEVRARYGAANGGVDLYQVEAVGGIAWDGGTFVVAGEYYRRDNLPTAERAHLYDDAAAGSFQAYPPNIGPSTAPTSGFVDSNGNGFLDPGEASGNPVVRQSNWLEVDSLPEQERYAVYSHLGLDVADGVELFVDGFFGHREFTREATALTISGQAVSAANPYNLTGAPVTVNYSFINDLGNDRQTGTSEIWQMVGGGNVDLGAWRMSGFLSYGEDETARSRNRINTGGLTAALNSTDINTALNPFSNGETGWPSQAVRQAVLDSIVQVETTAPTFQFTNGQIQFDGPIFTLPGGQVRLAVGGEYQGVHREQVISSARPSGNNPPPNVAPDLERRVLSGFGELFVPIFGDSNALPGIRSLELSLAARYDHYLDRQLGPALDILNTDTVNPKIGLRYRPIEELTLRGSWGTSFRAPALGDYSFGAPTVIAPTIITPGVAEANGLPALPVYTTVLLQGGHTLGLDPETATTWTLGFDWRPEWVSGLFVSATYYNIRFENQITAPASTSQLTDPAYVAALTSSDSLVLPGSGLVIFNPTTEQLQAYLAHGGSLTPRAGIPANLLYGSGSDPAPGQTTPVYALVEGLTQNSGILETDGFDVSIVYSAETGIGNFTIGEYFTYVLNYRQSLIASAPLQDFLNTVNFPLRFVSRTHLGFSSGRFSANAFVNYYNSYENRAVTPAEEVDSYTTVDLNLAYNFGEGLPLMRDAGIALIVQNLFDADPPYARTVQGVAVQNFDSQNASALGRLVSIQLRLRF
jgi:iron complex outermembrane receptor protein